MDRFFRRYELAQNQKNSRLDAAPCFDAILA
jgi:hypothetical protein